MNKCSVFSIFIVNAVFWMRKRTICSFWSSFRACLFPGSSFSTSSKSVTRKAFARTHTSSLKAVTSFKYADFLNVQQSAFGGHLCLKSTSFGLLQFPQSRPRGAPTCKGLGIGAVQKNGPAAVLLRLLVPVAHSASSTNDETPPQQANTRRSPLQLEVGHGSVGVQQDVQGVGLHSFAVTLNGCLVLAFLEISVSLTTIETATESGFAPFMQLKLHSLSTLRCGIREPNA